MLDERVVFEDFGAEVLPRPCGESRPKLVVTLRLTFPYLTITTSC